MKLTFPSASYILSTSSTRGLKGGGKENKPTTWDYGRLAKAVSLVPERDATSKKDLWYAIAQQYFSEFRVCKQKIDRLRTIWRTNCGNIRELVRDFRDTVNEPVSMCSISSETSETEKVPGVKIDEGVIDETEGYTDNLESSKYNGIQKDTPSDEIIDKESSRSLSSCDMSLINESCKKLKDCHLADFLGCVFGSTISSVYGKHF